MKRTALPLFLALALLTGCGPTAFSESGNIMSTGTVEPTPSPMTPEEAAVLYARFLQDDVTTLDTSGRNCYHSQFYSGLDMERAMDIYFVQDLTGDGIPELYNNNPGHQPIWSVKDGQVIIIGGTDTCTKIAPNGGYFYHRPGGGPTHDRYWYQWLSPESKTLPEASFSDWHPGDEPDYYEFNGEEVTKEEWETLTAPYFALYDQGEAGASLRFREWVDTLDVELPSPEMNEAKVYRIFTPFVAYDWNYQNPSKDSEILRVWDFDSDGIPEIYEDVEPYLVYGIVGLHVEELGPAADPDKLPETSPSFHEWHQHLSEKSQS